MNDKQKQERIVKVLHMEIKTVQSAIDLTKALRKAGLTVTRKKNIVEVEL